MMGHDGIYRTLSLPNGGTIMGRGGLSDKEKFAPIFQTPNHVVSQRSATAASRPGYMGSRGSVNG